ncbi:hypothetical protein B0F90DRAFT_1690749 [Multifurca ochricompacta]|uniref:Uncharacterized protein n=1 Tax=Multifurca ochricompacta TaxID=376703 RepID=A0AAD4MA09_9AGAM|nr:hypothetical protein B0F90DRAFT_1690749 [Multifurca ochricompacta]
MTSTECVKKKNGLDEVDGYSLEEKGIGIAHAHESPRAKSRVGSMKKRIGVAMSVSSTRWTRSAECVTHEPCPVGRQYRTATILSFSIWEQRNTATELGSHFIFFLFVYDYGLAWLHCHWKYKIRANELWTRTKGFTLVMFFFYNYELIIGWVVG